MLCVLQNCLKGLSGKWGSSDMADLSPPSSSLSTECLPAARVSCKEDVSAKCLHLCCCWWSCTRGSFQKQLVNKWTRLELNHLIKAALPPSAAPGAWALLPSQLQWQGTEGKPWEGECRGRAGSSPGQKLTEATQDTNSTLNPSLNHQINCRAVSTSKAARELATLKLQHHAQPSSRAGCTAGIQAGAQLGLACTWFCGNTCLHRLHRGG